MLVADPVFHPQNFNCSCSDYLFISLVADFDYLFYRQEIIFFQHFLHLSVVNSSVNFNTTTYGVNFSKSENIKIAFKVIVYSVITALSFQRKDSAFCSVL